MVLINEFVLASLSTDAGNYNPLQLFITSEYPVPGSKAVEQQTRYPKNESIQNPNAPWFMHKCEPEHRLSQTESMKTPNVP